MKSVRSTAIQLAIAFLQTQEHHHHHHHRFWAEVFISTIVLIPSLWVAISNKFKHEQKHWAYGVIGTILGFWLAQAK